MRAAMLPGEPVLPAYGCTTIGDLLPCVAAHLLSGSVGLTDVLGLPDARRYVIVLVDGLGWELLCAELRELSWFSQVFGDAIPITAGVPATTATSLASLGTGLTPGQHGLVGYCFQPAPGQGRLNALTWEGGPDPLTFQPHTTWFEQLAAAGVAVSSVSPAHFEASGLTLCAHRGPAFVPVLDEADLAERVRLTVAASRRGSRSLVYHYERSLDHVGHGFGVDSIQWRSTLIRIDGLLEQLRDALDPDVCLLVTGDHGMVDVPKHRQIIVEDHVELGRDVELVAGEGRLRQLYTSRPLAVRERWQQLLGDRAWVLTRKDAIARGWFGKVDDRVRPRYGDVIVAMRDNWAIMTRESPGELDLVGQHGSLTSAEMVVPLLVDEGWPGQ